MERTSDHTMTTTFGMLCLNGGVQVASTNLLDSSILVDWAEPARWDIVPFAAAIAAEYYLQRQRHEPNLVANTETHTVT
jgi:hypothetical protein